MPSPARLASVWLLAMACSSEPTEVDAFPRSATPHLAPAPDERPPPVAPATALLVLALHRDGTVEVADVRVKPIPFRAHGMVPYAGSLPAPMPSAPTVKGSGAAHVPRIGLNPVSPDRTDYALVASGGGPRTPVVLPLALGAPGERHGDVMDRWEEGELIVRAPAFSEGTQWSLLRLQDSAPMHLAEATAP